jgi:phosphoribosylaminoimidazolecarboxamide formyltransferase/IMP cyclohydrolase
VHKIGILVSGRGSNLQSILDNIKAGVLSLEVAVVISDKPGAMALERAAKAGIPAVVVDRKKCADKAEFESKIDEALRQHNVELIVLAGFMRILSAWFVKRWALKMINIHPALLPSFTGLDAQGQAVNYGVKVSGCTVHFVDEGTDTGPIILQKVVPVHDDDTGETLADRILVEEHKALPEALKFGPKAVCRFKDAKSCSKNKLTENVPQQKDYIKKYFENEVHNMKIKRALLSVSDKTGIVKLAQFLHEIGVEIISTGGTMKTIKDAGIPVTYVSDVTGFPEIMDGRVKTLNPKIHGGILGVRSNPEHMKQMEKYGIKPIDLVVVNLYPFRETIAKPNVTEAEAIENIDIGGPAMLRAAAKNFRDVVIITNPARYTSLIAMLQQHGDVDLVTRKTLAKEAFAHTSEYDAAISEYLTKQLINGKKA